MYLYDLHTHSTASDGTTSPDKLVEEAHRLGISTLALTDHDTVKGCYSAEIASKKTGVRFIPGVEMTGKEINKLHILGLGIDYKNTDLLSVLEKCAESRIERIYLICDHLIKQGIYLNPEKINKSANNVGKPHIALEMIAQGYVSSVREAFDKYLDSPAIDKIKQFRIGYNEAAKLIHGAGGLVVLAHPYQMKKTNAELEEFVRAFVCKGLDAIEVFYSHHTVDMARFYLYLAEKYNLLISCGSDYHGSVKPDIDLGTGKNNSILRLREELLVDEGRLILNTL